MFRNAYPKPKEPKMTKDIVFYVDDSPIVDYIFNNTLEKVEKAKIYHTIELKNYLLQEPYGVRSTPFGSEEFPARNPKFNKESQLIIDSEVFHILSKHTLMMCRLKDNKTEGVATAIYLQYRNKSYLFSVGHTFNQCKYEDVFFFLKKEVNISMKNCSGIIMLPHEENNFKEFDLMVVNVNEEMKDLLERNNFVPFYLGDNIPFYDCYGKYNICYGFPASYNNTSNFSKIFNSSPLCLDLPFEYSLLGKKGIKDINKSYKEINFVDTTLIPYNRRMMSTDCIGTKQTNLIPELNGMSGAGVWYIKNYPFCTNEYYLEGIFIGISREKKYIYVDKIKSILGSFDKLNENERIDSIQGIKYI